MQKHGNFSSKSFRQNSDKSQLCRPQTPLGSADDVSRAPLESAEVEQWEKARCPICMEHPHNAVLLQCSSYDKGCRPYMCNTSYRHSNCLDQFCKSSVSSPSTLMIQGVPSARENSHETVQTNIYESELEHKLACPLCRGEIYGWFVVDAARKFMNSKARSCSYERCNFSGNYSELRKHARSDHPAVRPSEVDPERQHDWTMLERESDFSDMINIFYTMNRDGEGGEEVEIEGISSEDSLQFLYSSFVSLMRVIRITMVNMSTVVDDTEDSDIHRQNNGSRSHSWERMPHNQSDYRHSNFGNNLNFRRNNIFRGNQVERSNSFRGDRPEQSYSFRGDRADQSYSFTGNLTQRMRQRRLNNIRSRWDHQRNNVTSNRRDQTSNNRREYRTW